MMTAMNSIASGGCHAELLPLFEFHVLAFLLSCGWCPPTLLG